VFHARSLDGTNPGRTGFPYAASRHEEHRSASEEPGVEVDPVCGMKVDPSTAAASWEYNGVTYYFCGRGCLLDFQEDPDAYLRG
jgi:Cu+-exporting ATPase